MIKSYYTREESEQKDKLALYAAMMSGDLEAIHFNLKKHELNAEVQEENRWWQTISQHNRSKPISTEDPLPVIKEEKEDYLNGAVRWYRCKKCGEWVPDTASECPRCREPFDIDLENKEIEITVEIEPLPKAAHLRKKLKIRPKTTLKTIISQLVDEGICNKGEYIEVGTIRANHSCEDSEHDATSNENCWKQYPDYQAGDIVLIKRQVSFAEEALAHLTCINEKYPAAQLLSERTVEVKMPQKGFLPKIRRIRVLACAGKAGILKALGLYSAEFENYPQKEIPFENGKLSVDVLALELDDRPLVITDYIESYPYL